MITIQHAVAFIPSLITVVGLITAHRQTKNQIKSEFEKMNRQISSARMETIPFKLLEFIDTVQKMIKGGNTANLEMTMLEQYQVICNTIFVYGSKEAVALVTELQENFYSTDHILQGDERDSEISLVYIALLASQVKFDLTGIITPPLMYFRMKVTDLKSNSVFRENLACKTNKVIDRMGLNNGFRVDNKQDD